MQFRAALPPDCAAGVHAPFLCLPEPEVLARGAWGPRSCMIQFPPVHAGMDCRRRGIRARLAVPLEMGKGAPLRSLDEVFFESSELRWGVGMVHKVHLFCQIRQDVLYFMCCHTQSGNGRGVNRVVRFRYICISRCRGWCNMPLHHQMVRWR